MSDKKYKVCVGLKCSKSLPSECVDEVRKDELVKIFRYGMGEWVELGGVTFYSKELSWYRVDEEKPATSILDNYHSNLSGYQPVPSYLVAPASGFYYNPCVRSGA